MLIGSICFGTWFVRVAALLPISLSSNTSMMLLQTQGELIPCLGPPQADTLLISVKAACSLNGLWTWGNKRCDHNDRGVVSVMRDVMTAREVWLVGEWLLL